MSRKSTLKNSLIAAGAVVVALVAFQPAPANADVQFRFNFGAPSYSHGWNGGHHRRHHARLSCNQVRRILRHQYGFRHLRTLDCRGDRYTFRGRRHGDAFRIKVNAYTGEVVRVRRV
jgi:hypothetical protein